MNGRGRRGGGALQVLLTATVAAGCGLGLMAMAVLGGAGGTGVVAACGQPQTVGATEYGGPGDPSSGTVGASGVSLAARPDSWAELGGTTFATATALGGLPYGTALVITAGDHTLIAYKRDIGLGGGPVDGHPRVIDLWWRLAQALGIPYEHGRWSGLVQIALVSASCPQALASAAAGPGGSGGGGIGVSAPLPLIPGRGAVLLGDGRAAAPISAPAAVDGMIAAGNQIEGLPYLYGGGHGIPLNLIAPYYDCSSSVAHLLYGGGLLSAQADPSSSSLESWGLPGPGRWVTIYANAGHVFMYVAGLRWDTWNAAGAGDGSTGIGWHPLVRGDQGFVVRHPPGL